MLVCVSVLELFLRVVGELRDNKRCAVLGDVLDMWFEGLSNGGKFYWGNYKEMMGRVGQDGVSDLRSLRAYIENHITSANYKGWEDKSIIETLRNRAIHLQRGADYIGMKLDIRIIQ